MREQQKESVPVSWATVVHGSLSQPKIPLTEAELPLKKTPRQTIRISNPVQLFQHTSHRFLK